MDFIEQHAAEDLPDARHRLQQIQGVGVMVLGGCDEAECDVTQQRIVVGDEGEIDCNALWYRWRSEALGNPVAVGFLGDFFADGRQIVLTVRIVHVCQKCTAFACQVHASAQQITGRAPLSGVHIGLREQATTHKHRNVMRVDLVVFRLPTVDGLPLKGRTEDKRDPMFRPEVRKPVPGKHAFGSQDDLLAGGRDSLEQRFWGGGHVPVSQCCTGLSEDAQVHGAGMEIDAAVKGVLLGVALH
jgi:hypothetical protein